MINFLLHSKPKHLLVVLSIAFANFLFTYKYVNRLGNDTATTISVVVSCLAPFLIFGIYFLSIKNKPPIIYRLFNSSKLKWYLIGGLSSFSILFFIIHPQNLLRIDRFEMIQLFWDNAFSKVCPYCPRSEGTNIPSPFPFYFFLALPFYLIHEVGVLSLSGVIAFIIVLTTRKYISNELKNMILLLLLTCPAVIYEIGCRSTNFLNSVLVLCLVLYIKELHLNSGIKIFTTGILAGCVMSTRSISFLFLFLIFLYRWRKSLFSGQFILLAVTTVMTFFVTFIPLILICKDKFITFNPFTVQTSLAPFPVMFAVAILSTIAILFTKDFFTWCLISGFACFFLFIGHCFQFGGGNYIHAIVTSNIDISYISFSLPFFLYSLCGIESKVCFPILTGEF
jgi:hypothetical protein